MSSQELEGYQVILPYAVHQHQPGHPSLDPILFLSEYARTQKLCPLKQLESQVQLQHSNFGLSAGIQ